MADPKTTPEQGAATANGPDPATAVLDDLENLRRERDQFLGLLQRTRADFENYEKRVQRDMAQERRYMAGPLILDLLPAFDNLQRAIEAGKKANEQGPLVQGVAMVQTQLLDILRRHGVTAIEAQGKPFDPNLHQAVMQQPSADVPSNTVLQVLEQGFLLHDRVLRPARVVVSTK